MSLSAKSSTWAVTLGRSAECYGSNPLEMKTLFLSLISAQGLSEGYCPGKGALCQCHSPWYLAVPVAQGTIRTISYSPALCSDTQALHSATSTQKQTLRTLSSMRSQGSFRACFSSYLVYLENSIYSSVV